MNKQEEIIKQYTQDFIKNTQPEYTRVRQLLKEKKIDVSKIIVVESFSDDTNLLFFVILTNGNNIYQFDYDYLHGEKDEGNIISWKDLTIDYLQTPYKESVLIGLKMIKDGFFEK